MGRQTQPEQWFLTAHIHDRWALRVSDGDARAEIEAFLGEARFRRRPPRWVNRQLMRRPSRRARDHGISFGFSDGWPGVCLVVSVSQKRIITVLVKEDEDD